MEKVMSKKAVTDLELVERVKTGSKLERENAIGVLYKKYSDSLLFRFRGLVENEEDARDLVMEAFGKMYMNLNRYKSDSGAFSTWLFKLTSNIFIDNLRKKKIETNSVSMSKYFIDEDGNVSDFEISNTSFCPEKAALLKERYAAIKKIVDNMQNKEQSKLIYMVYFLGLSYQEIVEETGMSLANVKTIIFRAKASLRIEFEKIGLK